MDGRNEYCYWLDLQRHATTNQFVWTNNNELSHAEQDFWIIGEPNNVNEKCGTICAPYYPNRKVVPEVAPAAKLNDKHCASISDKVGFICTMNYQTCPEK